MLRGFGAKTCGNCACLGLHLACTGSSMPKNNESRAMLDTPVFTGAYAPLNTYIAPLRGDLWRMIIGLGVISAIYYFGQDAYFWGIIALKMYVYWPDIPYSFQEEIVLSLASDVVPVLAVLVAAIWPARRMIKSLVGPLRPAWSSFWRTFLAMSVVSAIGLALTWALDPTFARNPEQDSPTFLLWLPFAVVALALRACAYVFILQGYIMGQLAAYSAKPTLWMFVPSVLLAILVCDTSVMGAYALIYSLSMMLYCMAVCDLTARTGNLGAGLAIQFSYDIFLLILIADPVYSGISFFTAEYDYTNPLRILFQFVAILAGWLAARLALKL
jgi:uncharacterized protein